MQRIIYILLIIILSSSSVFTQEVNSWISYNQTYVKFKVAEDGVYRIKRSTLVAANNGFITVNPRNIQVFARGEEQAIYVYGENDFSFDPNDYIELYCTKNDGFLDSSMYDNPSEQTNPFYSQINDTISYYITWENSPSSKKRYSTYSSANYNTYSALTFVREKQLINYTNKFYWGQRVSNYSSGKGWFDASSFIYGSPVTKTTDVSHRISSSNIDVQFSVCGVPNSDVYSNLNHHLKIHLGSTEMFVRSK